MSEIELEAVNGKFKEDDLWKLFSESPDKGSDTVRFYCDIEKLLANMKLEDRTRFYRVYDQGPVLTGPNGGRFCATVTQANLRRVAKVIDAPGYNTSAVIQYLGPRE